MVLGLNVCLSCWRAWGLNPTRNGRDSFLMSSSAIKCQGRRTEHLCALSCMLKISRQLQTVKKKKNKTHQTPIGQAWQNVTWSRMLPMTGEILR